MLDAPLDPGVVALDTDADPVVHRHGEGLSASHPAEARREGDGAGQTALAGCCPGAPATSTLAGELGRDGGEGLEGPLQDALRTDVDPGAGRHLPVHRQPELLEPTELVPARPVPHEVRVGDEHARSPLVCPHDSDRTATLDEQCLVHSQVCQRAHDRVVRRPVPGCLARAAVDDELFRVLGHLRVEVVHEHAHRRLGLPRPCCQVRTAGGAYDA